jgi:hypothetical protein
VLGETQEFSLNTCGTMPAAPENYASEPAVDLDAAADQAIAVCGGDVREAVNALIVANDF